MADESTTPELQFKDHNVRELVNDLRDIAIKFHSAGQLRSRISESIGHFLAAGGWVSGAPKVQGEPTAAMCESPPASQEAPTRTKLLPMPEDDGAVNQWYFDCDGHYIDVVREEDGKCSIFFRNRADGKGGWLSESDQTPPASAEQAPIQPCFGNRAVIEYTPPSLDQDWGDMPDAVAQRKSNPSGLAQQVAAAQAEMATWAPAKRASVRLEGGNAAGESSSVPGGGDGSGERE